MMMMSRHNSFFILLSVAILTLTPSPINSHVLKDEPTTRPSPTFTSSTTPSPNTVEIFVQNGRLIGEKVHIRDLENRSVVRFLGVPYAKPPLGRLRFRRPEQLTKWTEPVRALNWPASCIQKSVALSRYINPNMSEDCLKLNLWTPGVNADEHSLRPVLFWIPGGSYHFGSSSFDLYDGEALAALSNSVVVTINYRVSTMGFLYSDKVEGIKGNQGLWDQAMALRWVHDNIRYFGGDPSKVTIMGESAGSWSASLHILSPVTRGLFSNAILMSGAALVKSVTTPERMVPQLLHGIRKAGCAAENVTSISEEVVACLQTLGAEQVDNVMHQMEGDTLDYYEIAVVDGEFLPASPISMLTSGNHKKHFNVLVSTVEDEESFFLQFSERYSSFRQNSAEPITLVEAKAHLLNILQTQAQPMDEGEQHQQQQLPTVDTVNRLYFNGINGHYDNSDLFQRQVGIAYGDYYLTCPTLEFAKALFRSSPDSVKVYQWLYMARLGSDRLQCGRWQGSCHVDDVYPVFGVPFRHRKLYHNREREISSEVIRFIRAFVLTGSPGEDQSEWQSYFLADGGRQLVAPYYEIGNDHKRHTSFKFNLKQLECGLIWNKFIYPSLPSSSSLSSAAVNQTD